MRPPRIIIQVTPKHAHAHTQTHISNNYNQARTLLLECCHSGTVPFLPSMQHFSHRSGTEPGPTVAVGHEVLRSVGLHRLLTGTLMYFNHIEAPMDVRT